MVGLLQADNTLSKANRASQFDAAKNLHVEMISQGMESAISSGNWTIRRFRMERKGVTQARTAPDQKIVCADANLKPCRETQ